jgi:hypothetical protein
LNSNTYSLSIPLNRLAENVEMQSKNCALLVHCTEGYHSPSLRACCKAALLQSVKVLGGIALLEAAEYALCSALV